MMAPQFIAGGAGAPATGAPIAVTGNRLATDGRPVIGVGYGGNPPYL